ncbi:hypothetical protein K456DRAFT_47412 [Colletotrichum gloeosporioides 23]|nr:hypothetical protein K456DRAFT_47412 [Colletotrichum gloeosporioides 23]
MNGQRCTNYVKSYDPKEYQFCAQFHNCLQQGCKNERTHQGDVDLRYCQDHRCVRPDCTSPRAPGGSTHCASHTCAAPACFAACPGASGDPHDPSRFCDRHRMCHTAGCRQFAHVRADGVPSKHCGAHYCRWEVEGGCDGARDPMSADGVCGAHTCVEAGCLRARDHREEGAQWCKDHTCKSRDCRWRRWLGEYCREHQCGRPGCPRHGEHNNYCDRHRACTTPGCDRFRRIDGENIGLHCEERECPSPAIPNTRQVTRSRLYHPVQERRLRRARRRQHGALRQPPLQLAALPQRARALRLRALRAAQVRRADMPAPPHAYELRPHVRRARRRPRRGAAHVGVLQWPRVPARAVPAQGRGRHALLPDPRAVPAAWVHEGRGARGGGSDDLFGA